MKIPLNSILIGLAVVAAGLGAWYYIDNKEPVDYEVLIESPKTGSTVTSPLTVSGKAHSNWYTDGEFPVEVRNSNGDVIGQGVAKKQDGASAEGGFVPFSATVTFTANPGEYGSLVFKRSNPGGKNEYNLRTEVPVNF
ncbi:MAG: hypothetical protein KBD50_03665 [Candidatus Pacebacteria bacterium]|nr:hypothetical protein [Candidatus Paceibacterota bacterium]